MNSLSPPSVIFIFVAILSSALIAGEKPPSKFSLVFSAALNKPLNELKSGNFDRVFLVEDFSGGYAMSNLGFGFGLKAVYDPRSMPFNLIGAISTNHFSNSETITFRLLPDMPESRIDLSLNGQIIEFAAGIQYLPFSDWRLSPYIGAAAGLNFISGQAESDGHAGVKLARATRIGLFTSGGLQFNVSRVIFGDIFLTYHWANLFGKDFETLLLSGDELPLNDGPNPNDPGDTSRKINFFNINLGLGIRL